MIADDVSYLLERRPWPSPPEPRRASGRVPALGFQCLARLPGLAPALPQQGVGRSVEGDKSTADAWRIGCQVPDS